MAELGNLGTLMKIKKLEGEVSRLTKNSIRQSESLGAALKEKNDWMGKAVGGERALKEHTYLLQRVAQLQQQLDVANEKTRRAREAIAVLVKL